MVKAAQIAKKTANLRYYNTNEVIYIKKIIPRLAYDFAKKGIITINKIGIFRVPPAADLYPN